MNVLDVCTGIGAFSKAAKSIDAKIIAQVEIDKNCQKLLTKQHPEAKQLGDIRNVKEENFAEPINLLCGGTPCQQLSIAGNGKGLAGEESQLWFEYLRLAQELRPSWLVWENVPNALYTNRGADFLQILRGLDECGYHVAWRVLDAQYYGVPQRRRRIFLVGHLGDGRAAEVLFERESLPGTLKTRPRTWKPTAVTGTLAASAGGTARPAGQANELDFLVFQRQRSNEFVEGATIASTLASRDHKDFGDLLAFSPATYKRHIEKNHLHAAEVAATLRAKNNNGYSDSEEHLIVNGLIRRLTPTECERLQGFPDGHTEGFSDTARYHMLGNSIALPVAKWIFERIKAVDSSAGISKVKAA